MKITKDDIGKWFVDRIGRYVKVTKVPPDNTDDEIMVMYQSGIETPRYRNGNFSKTGKTSIDVVSKLDDLEVELLGLNDDNNQG